MATEVSRNEEETNINEQYADCRAKIKNALRKQQQQLLVKLKQNTPKDKKTKKIKFYLNTKETPTSSDDVAQVMWHSLTPNAKKKIKLNVSNSSDPGMNKAFCRVTGVNLSNQINIRTSEMTPLQERIEQFFNHDYVTCDTRYNKNF